MKKVTYACLALVMALVLPGVTLLTALGGADAAKTQETGPGGGIAPGAKVPGWVRVIIDKHAGLCPQVTASLLAAQLYTESGFNRKATSPAGARGIAQFMPGTWSMYGVDGDGDGDKNILDPEDAIAAQAHYDCVLAKAVKDVPGDSTDNMLAAYNAGEYPVIKYGGIPPYRETRDYVKKIRSLADKWAADDAAPAGNSSKHASRAITAAKRALGTWYRWAGTCTPPFEGAGGCDCSSLAKMAWAAGGVNLPRQTYEQVRAGHPVKSISQLRPGDLLFSEPSSAGPGHVGMYIGNSQVIDAPHTGATVRIQSLRVWKSQIVAMRHIG
ncbi:putative secreted transglycosylase (plasmid) [Streptomyces alboflavus]|uniref:Putative secreted transglycosylase n=1 Tax=Streptomyces alboflavus TaxID=67267 RepID=A0A291W577_9ACTN|nr:bifunctional lytic transglycosylase/C40 family peptidase [Streptomyces alboflavus]ATM24806.1 putative secreted transglycosylase [Streptomyces alboflavus]